MLFILESTNKRRKREIDKQKINVPVPDMSGGWIKKCTGRL